MPFSVDLQCCKCGHLRSVMLARSTADPDPEDLKCPKCGSKKFTRMIGGNFASYESSDSATKEAKLRKRSLDHTKRTAKSNVERIIERDKQRKR